MTKLIQTGAEAEIYQDKNNILKKRVEKSYRIKEIDEKIRKYRTRHEAKILEKLSKVIAVPKVIKVDEDKKEITMEFIEGLKLSENFEKINFEKTAIEIGKTIGKMHDQDIIHGDLTTSNMLLYKNKVFFIDFGLSYHSHKIEDKAVDLHVLKQALEAKHYKISEILITIILKNYNAKQCKEILEKLKKVEARGRYKDKY
ncbi:Kae1-associated serine/threonine protein kinase [Candidatus Pacearchaeota archaeon]|nr:hypothetical protein [uncultured archaeon]MBS3093452.1 Kae1-associated serine/threonine protein kinase [Candidatus Pacearchaeota archaeon]